MEKELILVGLFAITPSYVSSPCSFCPHHIPPKRTHLTGLRAVLCVHVFPSRILVELCTHIEAAPDTDGLYRKAGNKARQKKLIEELNNLNYVCVPIVTQQSVYFIRPSPLPLAILPLGTSPPCPYVRLTSLASWTSAIHLITHRMHWTALMSAYTTAPAY